MHKAQMIRFLLLASFALMLSPAASVAHVHASKARSTGAGLPRVADARQTPVHMGTLQFGPGRPQDRAFIQQSMGSSANNGAGQAPGSVIPPPAGGYKISYADLNGRRRSGMFVRFEGPRFCADGECNIELFVAQPGGAWKSVLSQTTETIRLLPHRTHGYKDILLSTHVFGIVEHKTYQWNGRQYTLAVDQLGAGHSYLRY